jgi:predicted neuraminidase
MLVSPRGIITSRLINENAPYPQCHASTIVETAPGELVAAWFGGTHERAPDVGIWVARQEDGEWREAVEVANGVQPDGTRLPTWNPVLFQPDDGPLVLFYKVGPSPREWWGLLMTSDDGGRTWSRPHRLPDGILGPIKNKPVALPDGSWLCPSSTESPEDGWQVHFERTRDGGRTWERIGPVAKGDGYDAIQPSILFHPDGRLQAICRTRNGVLVATYSEDGGDTWSHLAPIALPNPNSGTDAVTLADGRHLLVYNHSAPPPERPTKGVRYPLDVALSTYGNTWRRVATLEEEPCESGYAYPAVIQASDGLVHITYTWNRQRIKHVVLDPAVLMGDALNVTVPANTASAVYLPADESAPVREGDGVAFAIASDSAASENGANIQGVYP